MSILIVILMRPVHLIERFSVSFKPYARIQHDAIRTKILKRYIRSNILPQRPYKSYSYILIRFILICTIRIYCFPLFTCFVDGVGCIFSAKKEIIFPISFFR